MTASAASPDAVLLAACNAAFNAVKAYQTAAERDEPNDAMSVLFERERLTLECVAATRAKSAAGIGAKARLLDYHSLATDGCEPSPEIVALAMSLAEDALAVVKAMVGGIA